MKCVKKTKQNNYALIKCTTISDLLEWKRNKNNDISANDPKKLMT